MNKLILGTSYSDIEEIERNKELKSYLDCVKFYQDKL